VHMLGTGLTGDGDRSDLWDLKLLQLPCFQVVCMHSSRGVALVQGELACLQGELFVAFELCFGGLRSLLELCFVSDVSSRQGVRDLSSSSDITVCLCLAFDRLLEFLFFRLFSFSFLLCYFMWVLSMHSPRGRLRTMCGSRTGGWSLPCVMSD
jgi:hypothetical protein